MFGFGLHSIAMMQAQMAADMAVLNSIMRGSPGFNYRSRSPGDRARKRWKRARASGKAR